MNIVAVHAVVVGVDLVVAVAARVDELLILPILLGVQEVIAVWAKSQLNGAWPSRRFPHWRVAPARK